jgi:hypothetical protein
MLNFTTDQWIIVALVFVLGMLVGGFIFSGGGRKWKHRYNNEVDRRTELERIHAEREKEWRERDSLRAAAIKGDRNNDGVVDARDRDRDVDGVPDSRDRDPTDDRRA